MQHAASTVAPVNRFSIIPEGKWWVYAPEGPEKHLKKLKEFKKLKKLKKLYPSPLSPSRVGYVTPAARVNLA